MHPLRQLLPASPLHLSRLEPARRVTLPHLEPGLLEEACLRPLPREPQGYRFVCLPQFQRCAGAKANRSAQRAQVLRAARTFAHESLAVMKTAMKKLSRADRESPEGWVRNEGAA
jgi:hypothetical protein